MSSTPEVHRALFNVSASLSEEEAARLYASRMADYARLIGLVFSVPYGSGVLATLALRPAEFLQVHAHPLKLANLLLVAGPLGVSFLLRHPRCPRWCVDASDVGLPLGIATVIAAAGHVAPVGFGLQFLPVMFAALLLVLRAGLVPSRPRRTVLVAALSAVPFVWASGVMTYRDRELVARLANEGEGAPLTWIGFPIATAIWCAALAVATTRVSRVIYSLQREISNVRRLGQYVLGELIGEGGMGSVYRAQHALLRRPTAIKLLQKERTDPQSLVRFEREVQITARLTHPNTVAIYDYGHSAEAVFYYAMEYLEGVTLQELVEQFGPQLEARVTHILLQATGALAEAHSIGLIHRDVKPANIFLCERGGLQDYVKLLDFGLVKPIGPADALELTQAGAITGTPQFLAPESISDPSSVDHRVDLYGLGCVAYFLLTGKPPFEGENVIEVCSHHLLTPPEPPSLRLGKPVDAELEELVLNCLAKSRGERPANARSLEARLTSIAARLPWTMRDARACWTDIARRGTSASAATVPDNHSE